MIDEPAQQRVLAAARVGADGGGWILTGGRVPSDETGCAGGWFVAPTVIDGLPAGHRLLCEEVFGPICAIVSAASLDETIRIANDVRYGLAAAVYTRDLDAALRVTELLATGQIKVNAPTSGVDFYLPFGGERDSSYGNREQGKAAQEFYTSLHTVTVLPAGRG